MYMIYKIHRELLFIENIYLIDQVGAAQKQLLKIQLRMNSIKGQF